MVIGFYFYQQPVPVEVGDDGFAANESVQSGIGAGIFIHGSVCIEYVYQRQVVPLPDFKIDRVMRRSNFYGTGTKLQIHHVITDNRDLAVYDRDNRFFTDKPTERSSAG